jgi:hypothetical protein
MNKPSVCFDAEFVKKLLIVRGENCDEYVVKTTRIVEKLNVIIVMRLVNDEDRTEAAESLSK